MKRFFKSILLLLTTLPFTALSEPLYALQADQTRFYWQHISPQNALQQIKNLTIPLARGLKSKPFIRLGVTAGSGFFIYKKIKDAGEEVISFIDPYNIRQTLTPLGIKTATATASAIGTAAMGYHTYKFSLQTYPKSNSIHQPILAEFLLNNHIHRISKNIRRNLPKKVTVLVASATLSTYLLFQAYQTYIKSTQEEELNAHNMSVDTEQEEYDIPLYH